MSAPALAIDFGSTRTKAAYFDESRGEPRLIELGGNTPAILTVFYVPKLDQGEILVGDEAHAMQDRDAEGILSGMTLKNELHKDGRILRGSGRCIIERRQLAARLFRFIRERCQEEVFPGEIVSKCIITVPPTFAQPQHEAIRQAAELGGFTTITIVEEPVAAAHGWLAESANGTPEYILVCDMGDTTAGISLVRRVDGHFRIDDTLSPAALASGSLMDPAVYLDHVSERVRRFAADCARAGIAKPPLLLVGGGSQLGKLARKLEALGLAPVHLATNPGFAVALGAATPGHLASLRQRIKADLHEIQKAETEFFELVEVLRRLSPKRAADWKQALGFGWPEVQWLIGACLLEQIPGWEQNPAAGVRYLEKAADAGFARAQACLAQCYDDGKGVPYDPARALKLWQAAAEAGESSAPIIVAEHYLNGRGASKDAKKAVSILREQKGCVSPAAFWWLGFCHMQGSGCAQDAVASRKYFKLALDGLQGPAQKGARIAQFFLGVSYLRGLGVETNPKAGVDWLSKAAEQGSAPAQCALADCYIDGIGVQPDAKKATDLLRLAADQGDPSAQAKLGISLLTGFAGTLDPAAAFEWFRKSAERGDPEGQHQFGRCLVLGIAGREDKREGFGWLKRAAEQDHPQAQHDLGYCLLNGLGVQSDPQAAVRWYEMSAAQDCPDGISGLALCYRVGCGLKQDPERAVTLFRKAAEMGHLDSMMWLGVMLCEQNEELSSKVEAVSWFRRASEQGHPGALFQLGLCHIHGIGVMQDHATGFSHAQRAAEMGNSAAQSFAGDCWLNGYYFPANPVEGVKWFGKAAEQGDTDGQFGLAKCMLNGWGVAPDADAAIRMLQGLADAGHAEANTLLGKYYSGASSQDPAPQVCPNGHGPLRDWQGQLRCWQCGWPFRKRS